MMNSKLLKVIGRHILFWLILMLTFAISEFGYRDTFGHAMIFELLFLPVRMVAVYVNYYVLMSRYLYKNQIFKYILYLIIVIGLMATLQRYIFIYWGYPVFFPDWWRPGLKPLLIDKIFQNAVIIATPVAFSIGIKVFSDWYTEKNKIKQLEKEKIATELKYLKSQINPHFLFNTLNNIYGLSIEKSDKVPGLILQLSDLLSYSLYESNQALLTLDQELKLIRDYVAIEKERYGDRVDVEWQINEEKIQDLKVAPLLLFPLVENAFKHGVKEETKYAKIDIKLKRKGEAIFFQIKNSLPIDLPENKKNEGIGLSNLNRRLKLLYPDAHKLETKKEKEVFNAELWIDLSGHQLARVDPNE